MRRWDGPDGDGTPRPRGARGVLDTHPRGEPTLMMRETRRRAEMSWMHLIITCLLGHGLFLLLRGRGQNRDLQGADDT